eukprot:PLAT14323.1.p1 GENE.PLAT14323.1~~PLAT14323.1.p1  ORF type:complete len:773 (-),score=425.20 PLAT14323.1:1090-3408(-)
MSEAEPVIAPAPEEVAESKDVEESKPRRERDRLTAEKGARIDDSAGPMHIGGPFELEEDPAWLEERAAVWEEVAAARAEEAAARERVPIRVTLRSDGRVLDGVAWESSPMLLAKEHGLLGDAVVARVRYSRRLVESRVVATGVEEEIKPVEEFVEGKMEEPVGDAAALSPPELWDLLRPLEGDCQLELVPFDDPDGRAVFWHSSAHVLGECMECSMGVKLCYGPPTKHGFYYDAYMGEEVIREDSYKPLEARAKKIVKKKQKFERLEMTKAEALRMFAHNPFKLALIRAKVPDGGFTSAYRCGPLIDLCPGPHIPSTSSIKAFHVHKHSSTNWLGNTDNDSLQRVYGVSFPTKPQLKEWKAFQKAAAERNHRKIGIDQELFFFHPHLSPGSAFFLPHGARIYNRLIDFIKKEYWARGYDEVVTPNVFNVDLWKTSGHYQHYKEHMFLMDVEKEEWALKPMNCPGHCVMFAHRARSWRELPLRLADFGVLHRNEFSGALSGLTRVRRFQQDDAHIFCRTSQIREEVAGVLDMMSSVYATFGFKFELNLSTRPKKAMGSLEQWQLAEKLMAEALDEFGHPWRLNPGDGAFYGPKIDIKLYDALGRDHQCATVQLDFQLPQNFDLRVSSDAVTDAADTPESRFERPVIIHRAILGSVERFMAVVTENYGGDWPFWLSPRQAVVVPIAPVFNDYAVSVRDELHAAGFYVDADVTTKKFKKKVREAMLKKYNYVLVVGEAEVEAHSVNVRDRSNAVLGMKEVGAMIEEWQQLADEHK